jgi:hypothetical protein
VSANMLRKPKHVPEPSVHHSPAARATLAYHGRSEPAG